jgi:hypothetical protein
MGDTTMTTSFDFFEGTRTENKAPQITVRKSGQLVLTGAAVALLGEGVTHVQLGYDAKARAVGIRPAPEEGRGRYRLRVQKNGSSLVDGRRFFAHHGLAPEKARTYEAESFGDGLVGFRFAEKAAETPAAEPKATRGGKAKARAAA